MDTDFIQERIKADMDSDMNKESVVNSNTFLNKTKNKVIFNDKP